MATEHLVQNGNYYGYPPCCIESFVQNFLQHCQTDKQVKAGKYTGFIPCVKHAEEILEGKIKLEDLILSTRKHSKPFLLATCG